MENRTLRDWKLYRQLRKTLDTICSDHEADQTWLMSSTSYSPNKSFDDILEITSIEDEGMYLYIFHSSEIRGLCSTKKSLHKTLENFPSFWNTEIDVDFPHFILYSYNIYITYFGIF